MTADEFGGGLGDVLPPRQDEERQRREEQRQRRQRQQQTEQRSQRRRRESQGPDLNGGLSDQQIEALMNDYERLQALTAATPARTKDDAALRSIIDALEPAPCTNDDCTICMEPLSDTADQNGTPVKSRSCTHVFHRGCIEQWLVADFVKSGECRCPNCRALMPGG